LKRGIKKINKRISKVKKGVWNTHSAEERVSQEASTPSTNVLMEVDREQYLACK